MWARGALFRLGGVGVLGVCLLLLSVFLVDLLLVCGVYCVGASSVLGVVRDRLDVLL